MKSGTLRRVAAIEFDIARNAARAVAGVPAAARISRELGRAGFSDVWIMASSGQPIDPEAITEIHRLAPGLTVHLAGLPEGSEFSRFPADKLIAAEDLGEFLAGRTCPFIDLASSDASTDILRGVGKPGDGVVSRLINRPISRRLSAALLRNPGIRPIHATIGTALIAAAMFIALVFGGRDGLVVGAFLFQAASVFDGVDGEIARATFRTSRKGAALDSAIDALTNCGAMLGLAINLHLRHTPEALGLAAWGLALLLLGWAMIGVRSLRDTGSVSFDGVKDRYRLRANGPLAARLMKLATMGTSRDFCALVYLLLVLAGIPIVGLYMFAVVTPVWVLFVIAALWPSRGADTATEGAA